MNDYPLDERKLVYRLLHSQLVTQPALMEGNFLLDLQQQLQQEALLEGVDISDHGAWDGWLGQETIPCELRVRKRFVLTPPTAS
ncbi:MAG: hypothetical protein ACRCZF_19795 [Gemmataceae bacterium]